MAAQYICADGSEKSHENYLTEKIDYLTEKTHEHFCVLLEHKEDTDEKLNRLSLNLEEIKSALHDLKFTDNGFECVGIAQGKKKAGVEGSEDEDSGATKGPEGEDKGKKKAGAEGSEDEDSGATKGPEGEDKGKKKAGAEGPEDEDSSVEGSEAQCRAVDKARLCIKNANKTVKVAKVCCCGAPAVAAVPRPSTPLSAPPGLSLPEAWGWAASPPAPPPSPPVWPAPLMYDKACQVPKAQKLTKDDLKQIEDGFVFLKNQTGHIVNMLKAQTTQIMTLEKSNDLLEQKLHELKVLLAPAAEVGRRTLNR
jgi:hypothetical protein